MYQLILVALWFAASFSGFLSSFPSSSRIAQVITKSLGGKQISVGCEGQQCLNCRQVLRPSGKLYTLSLLWFALIGQEEWYIIFCIGLNEKRIEDFRSQRISSTEKKLNAAPHGALGCNTNASFCLLICVLDDKKTLFSPPAAD